jgi:DNA-binding MarR family transcriptional regulator
MEERYKFLLRLVLANPGMFPRELAEELNLTRSTITRFLDSLEKQNLLVRQTIGSDGREVQIFPTQKAEKIQTQLNDTGKELTKLMKDILGKEELSEIVLTLRQIKKSIDKS